MRNKVVGSLAALALLGGCAPDVSKYKSCGMVAGSELLLEDRRSSCDNAAYLLGESHKMLAVAGVPAPSPWRVLVRDEQNFKKPGDTEECSGYSSIGWLETNNTEGSLLHELLHQRGAAELKPGSSWHEGWLSQGYYGLDIFWSWYATGFVVSAVDVPFCQWYTDLRKDHADALRQAGYPVDQWRMARDKARFNHGCGPDAE